MSKITNDGLTRSGTGCFIAVSYGNSGRHRVNFSNTRRHSYSVILCHTLLSGWNTGIKAATLKPSKFNICVYLNLFLWFLFRDVTPHSCTVICIWSNVWSISFQRHRFCANSLRHDVATNCVPKMPLNPNHPSVCAIAHTVRKHQHTRINKNSCIQWLSDERNTFSHFQFRRLVTTDENHDRSW